MAWRIELSEKAKKDLAAIDKPIAQRILAFLRERVLCLDDPRQIGEALKGPTLGEFWRYRVGNWRIIARIEDDILRVLVIRVRHRKEAYRG